VCITFSAGPKTGDHRLVEEEQVPRTTDILIAQAAKINKVCHKFFRINADGTTICEDNTGKVVASTMDFRTLTTVSCCKCYTYRLSVIYILIICMVSAAYDFYLRVVHE
jgi:hypothetical protein